MTQINTTITTTKRAILVGRHELLEGQKLLLQKAGIEIIRRIEQLPTQQNEIAQLISKLKSEGINAIVVQALPLNLLAMLHSEASKAGIEVFIFRMEAIAVANSEEEAKKLVAEKPAFRTFLKAPNAEKIRVLECVALERIKAIKVETETVATV